MRTARRLLPVLLLATTACATFEGRPDGDGGVVQAVPIQVVNNIVLVPVVLNQRQGATLILDTGAQHTLLNPDVAARAGLDPTSATKRTIRVVGGKALEVPFVGLALLSVGEAEVENLTVGVYRATPSAPIIDGILGADFLSRFTITIDRKARQLRLERQP
jgi:predicted aspartyl protease